MPVVSNPPTTNGALVYSYPERGKKGCLVERVSITAASASATLSKQLPNRCRVLMASLKVVSAVGLNHSANSGTSVLGDTIALVNALPTTNATSTTTTMVMAVSAAGATSTVTSTALASRSVAAGTGETSAVFFAGEQLTAANAYVTGTSDTTLYLIPMDTGGSEDFNVASGTATNGYFFGSTGTVDVQVWFEEFDTIASS